MMSYSQPKGLYPLSFTELWERFGFYAVQTILVLYMSRKMGLSDDRTFLLYGAFSSMIYLTPVLGGYIADRFMGFRQAVMLGGFLFILGYAIMAIPSTQALFLGMSIVIIANGFFKPNISSMIGELYSRDDPRRDGGFTIFYMCINIGSLIPPLFAGPLVTYYGWNWGFFIASFGLAIGLIIFVGCKKMLGRIGEVPVISPLYHSSKHKTLFYFLLGLGILSSIALLHVLFLFPTMTNFFLIIVSIGVLVMVLFFLFKERKEQRHKLIACLILIVISIGFWAVYTQTFTSLMLFADRNMEKRWLGIPIDAEFMQFFNPFFIILLGPFLSRFWVWLAKRGKNPSTPAKFTYGLFFLSLGFLFLAAGITFFNTNGISSPWWLIGSYFLQTIGELALSPIGLAMITRLAPHHLIGMMMGVWFLTQSAAFAIGGTLATWASAPKDAAPAQTIGIYSNAFFYYGLLTLFLAAISYCMIPFIKQLIGPLKETPVTPKA
jgi:POT family proton-dependent oligopeptide transporter